MPIKIKRSKLQPGLFYSIKQHLYGFSMKIIISIYEIDVFAMGAFQASIARSADTRVLLMVDDTETRILLAILVAEFSRPISGAVIYQNHFQILISLLPDAPERSRKVLLAVIDVNDYADQRVRHQT